jgi:hypothetical protein
MTKKVKILTKLTKFTKKHVEFFRAEVDNSNSDKVMRKSNKINFTEINQLILRRIFFAELGVKKTELITQDFFRYAEKRQVREG